MSQKTIDAVLPMVKDDFGRFKILHTSMKRYFRDLGTCWVVTQDEEFDIINSKIQERNYKVIMESQLVPEFKEIKSIRGWHKQQIIKFAIAKRIESDFYLTLDADVICVRPVKYSDLIKNEKAICQIEEIDFHPKWYKYAERILGFKHSGLAYGVTPSLFSKEAVIKLQNFLSERANQKYKDSKISWRLFLIKNLPWTEYALYFTFLEGMKLFGKYYNNPCVENICGNKDSVWSNEQISLLKPEKIFTKQKYFFIVIQSSVRLKPNDIWAKVGKYLK